MSPPPVTSTPVTATSKRYGSASVVVVAVSPSTEVAVVPSVVVDEEGEDAEVPVDAVPGVPDPPLHETRATAAASETNRRIGRG